MKQVVEGSVFTMFLNKYDSSFVNRAEYDAKLHILSIGLNGIGLRSFANVPMEVFMEFSLSNSYGSFYHSNIKNNYKMAKTQKQEEAPVQQKRLPKKINKSSDEYRWIELDIDIDKIDRKFLVVGAKSGHRYLKCKLRMEPDGDVDKYGNLGFISQTVPTEVYKKDKTIKGEILGNACEIQWDAPQEEETRSATKDDLADDLPF